MHRVVLVLVIVFVILMFLGCLDMHIHSRPTASPFVPEEAYIDFVPENHLQVIPAQYLPGRVDGGWVVVVVQGDNPCDRAEAAPSYR
jgi:hypothetical protein